MFGTRQVITIRRKVGLNLRISKHFRKKIGGLFRPFPPGLPGGGRGAGGPPVPVPLPPACNFVFAGRFFWQAGVTL
jgi:hypothetical protein